MGASFRVLQVTAADVTVKKLLLPLIDRLKADGHDVHIACSAGKYVPELQSRGYAVHPVQIERRISPLSNLRSLWALYRLIRRERFDVVHVHTPVAAVLGRVAAWMAGTPVVIYTAHGFYFHDQMAGWLRRLVVELEKLLGHITDLVFTQSREDAVTAVQEGICPEDRVKWIGNGVDTSRFSPDLSDGCRAGLGLSASDRVVGYVGRLVREKGIIELIEAMEEVARTVPGSKLLVVGDTLSSDRDQDTKRAIDNAIEKHGLRPRVVFAGFREDVPRVMAAIDLFVLPSHREGMPRTIIEAMASGKPVVATNIRGCREEVVPELTGLLVPLKAPKDLAEAISGILSRPSLAERMGSEGRRRAIEFFDESLVLDKQVRAYAEIIQRKRAGVFPPVRPIPYQHSHMWVKRAIDVLLSSLGLAVLSVPFLVIAAIIRLESPGPVFFRQERIGRLGRPFQIFKFRTMVDGAVQRGLGLNVSRDDPRITRAGKLLRDCGLDELPQLINVLRGEMSLVGPRPTLRYQVERYNDFQRLRLLARPGITSLAVVNGRNLLSWAQRIRLDVWYVKRWSLWLDLKIMLHTFWAVLVTREGVYGAEGINDDFVSNAI
ncbi:MAG: sugar transferase [Chloroflexi bacterium]|nr:sugar transferase [Chloroflexota bacterium]